MGHTVLLKLRYALSRLSLLLLRAGIRTSIPDSCLRRGEVTTNRAAYRLALDCRLFLGPCWIVTMPLPSHAALKNLYQLYALYRLYGFYCFYSL